MGIRYLILLYVAVATHVYIQPEIGATFIQSSKRAAFYQDTVRVSINVQIDSPRVQLDYTQYGECDASYQIDGVGMCRHLFDGYDDQLFDFLDLSLVKMRKEEMQAKQFTTENVSLIAKQRALHDLHKQMSEKLNATYTRSLKGHSIIKKRNADSMIESSIESESKIKNRRDADESNNVAVFSDQAKWLALIDHVFAEIRLIHNETCNILLSPTHEPYQSIEIVQYCKDQLKVTAIPENYMTMPNLDRFQLQLELQELFRIASITLENASGLTLEYAENFHWLLPGTSQTALIEAAILSDLSGRSAVNAEIIRPDTTQGHNETEIKNRSERSVAVAVGATVIAVGTATFGYFIGKSSTELALQELQEDMERSKQSILSLDKAVELNEDTLDEIASILKTAPSMVLTGKSTLPFDIRFEQSQVQQGLLNTRFDVQNALHISRLNTAEFLKFQTNVLTLQNSRLPLDTSFLIALRAQCLSLQIHPTTKEKKFCNELAFYSTRWDTGVSFNGIGLTYLDEDETMVKSVIFSFSVEIPVLYADDLEQLDIINLGRFESPGTVNRVQLPDFGIITKSGILHPFLKDKCIQLESSTVCPTLAIGNYDECLHSTLNGTLSAKCKLEKLQTQKTCIDEVSETFVVVSLWKPATVHYGTTRSRHYHKNAKVSSFDVVNRTEVNGVIFCEQSRFSHVPPELKVPRRTLTKVVNVTIEQVDTTETAVKLQTENDRLTKLEHKIQIQKTALRKSEAEIKTKTYHTNSTIELVKSNIHNAITNIPSNIKEHVKNILVPILTPILSVLTIMFISLLSMKCIIKKCRQQIDEQECFAVTREAPRNNRTEEAIM